MSAPPIEPADLLDLKLLPAWLKESDSKNHCDHYAAEEAPAKLRSSERGRRHKDRKFRSRERRQDTQHPTSKPDRRHRGRMRKTGGARRRDSDRANNRGFSTGVAQVPQNPLGETLVFLPPRGYSKMWLRRSSPGRLPIRCLFWLGCSSKNRGDMKFVSRQRPKRRFINLARTAESQWTGNSSSETHSGSRNVTFIRSML